MFNVNKELFGKYALIQRRGESHRFIYKVVTLFESNFYCDVPIGYDTKPYIHEECIPVLNIICCGIDESQVIRVALKDCQIIDSPQEIGGYA